MSMYTPDRWIVVRFVSQTDGNPDPIFYKIFGSWGGSYLYGESWKLSSGFDLKSHIAETDERFQVSNFSGSVYDVSKHDAAYGFNSWTWGVYENLVEKAAEHSCEMIALSKEEAFGLLQSCTPNQSTNNEIPL